MRSRKYFQAANLLLFGIILLFIQVQRAKVSAFHHFYVLLMKQRLCDQIIYGHCHVLLFERVK